MANIFLTGATGFLGSHLLPALVARKHSVETDMRKFRFTKFDCIVHLAAVTSIKTEFDGKLFDANVVLSEKIFSNPARIIYASSCSAKYMTNPYAYTKRYCEYLGAIHGNALGLRFHNIYGPRNNKGIVRHLLNQEDGANIEVKGSNLIRDYIHVDDIVNEIARLITLNNIGVIDIGTGVGTRTVDLVSTFEKVSGKRFNITTNDDWGGGNEPTIMISNNFIQAVGLEEGLKKTIDA